MKKLIAYLIVLFCLTVAAKRLVHLYNEYSKEVIENESN